MSVWDLHPSLTDRVYSLQLATDLLGGTTAMRGGGAFDRARAQPGYRDGDAGWLVRFKSDTDETFRRRWERSYLFGAFSSAVSRTSARVFSETIDVQGLPDDLAGMAKNCDRDGTSLHAFADEHFARKIAFGFAGIIVAMPGADSLPPDARTPEGAVSVTGQERYNVRPYLVPVHRSSVTDWTLEQMADGGTRLTSLSVREDDTYAMREGERVTVERLRRWRVVDGVVTVEEFQRVAGGDKKAQDAGEVPTRTDSLPIRFIPFVVDAVSDATGGSDPLQVGLPLDELAWLNLQHFRETAEQGVALLMARSEGLLELGCEPEKVGQALEWGLGRAKRTSAMPGSYDLKFVGPSGRGVELGAKSLQEIEARMEQLGSAPMSRQSGNLTATANAIDESRNDTLAAKWARGTEAAIATALRMADVWVRQASPEPLDKRLPDLTVTMRGTSLVDSATRQSEARLLLDSWREGAITHRMLVEGLVERRILPAGTDIDALIEEVAEEGIARLARQVEAMRASGGAPGGEGDAADPADDSEDGEKQSMPPEMRRMQRVAAGAASD